MNRRQAAHKGADCCKPLLLRHGGTRTLDGSLDIANKSRWVNAPSALRLSTSWGVCDRVRKRTFLTASNTMRCGVKVRFPTTVDNRKRNRDPGNKSKSRKRIAALSPLHLPLHFLRITGYTHLLRARSRRHGISWACLASQAVERAAAREKDAWTCASSTSTAA
jgi:hypothetical protein